MIMTTTISQKSARETLGSPEQFEGGVYVTKNGVAELFIQTAREREQELAQQAQERQAVALVKLALLSLQDIEKKQTMTPEEALARLKLSRK